MGGGVPKELGDQPRKKSTLGLRREESEEIAKCGHGLYLSGVSCNTRRFKNALLGRNGN